MGKEKKLKKESFMQGVLAIMFSQVLIKILGLAYKLYLTNRDGFGDEGNAIYGAGFQIYALLLTLSSIGVPTAISKMVSEKIAVGDNYGAHRIFKIAFVTFALIGFVGTLILFLGAGYISTNVLEIPEAEYTLIALSPSIFFVAIASVIRGYFNGMQNLSITAKSQTFEQVFKTVFTILVVEMIAIASGVNTTLMAAGANLATTLAVLVSFLYLFKYYNRNKKEIWKQTNGRAVGNTKNESAKKVVKNILAVSIPISLSSIISAVNKNIDAITVVRGLKTFLTESAAKVQYGILSGKVDILIGLPLSFNIAFATALVPSVSSSLAKGDKQTITKRVSFSLLVTMLIGLPCTIGLCVFAEPILKLLFPNAPEGTLILQIASFTILFTVLAQTINGALQGLGKIFVPAIALGSGVLVKLILNLVLVSIPSIGVNGAAFSSVVCHIISFSIVFYVLRKNIELDLGFVKFVFKPVLATFIMSVCSYVLYLKLSLIMGTKIATIVALLFAVVIYGASVVVLKIFTKEDINMLPYGKKIGDVLTKIGIYK
mgnify:CR=1 FL=1